jgi:tetratricopeptide (TPR) repeat protein
MKSGQSAKLLAGGQDPALVELIDELTARLVAGEPVDVDAYARAHPEYADQLRQLVPALRALNELGNSAGRNPAPLPGVAPPDDKLLGTLGDFRIVREVGRGGMGVVYEAVQISLARRVALKALPFASTLDERQLQRFKNEAHAAAQLHHPHIVPVYATGCERGVHYYAMQFIDGQTLADLIGQLRRAEGRQPADPSAPTGPAGPSAPAAAPLSGALSLPPFVQPCRPGIALAAPAADTAPGVRPATEPAARGPGYFRGVARLGIEAAEALEYAHQLGIIHRDVKPANLLVDGQGRLWVTDFGLAHVRRDVPLTLTGEVVGTLRYMSPEQARARPGAVDHRADVYSLGATLYELLTLEPAFGGKDVQELLRQIALEEPRPPRRLHRAIPAELDTVVLKALAKDPAERYATAQELADDLKRLLEDKPIRARRATPVQRARKWMRRHRAATWAFACVAAIGLLAGGAFWYEGHRRAEAVARQVRDSLATARGLLAEDQPARARQKLAEAQARLGPDRGRLGGLAEEVDALAAELRRFEDYFRLIEQAHEAEIPAPVDLAGEVAAPRRPAAPPPPPRYERDQAKAVAFLREALSRYGVLEHEDWLAMLERGWLGTSQVQQLRRSVHEELLWLADDALRRGKDHRTGRRLPRAPAARLAFAYLAKAEPLGTRVAAFYRMRARCRRALQDLAAARRDERRARQTPARVALDHYLSGLAAYDAKDKAAAVRHFEAALRREPSHYWSLMWLGKSLSDLGQREQDYAAAVGVFSGCILHRPSHPWAWTRRGDAYRHWRRYDQAVADYSQAIALDPKYAEAWNNRGAAHHNHRQYAKAVADFSQAIELEPTFGRAWCNRATAQARLQRFREATADVSRALDLDPKDALIWAIRGKVYLDQQQYEQTVTACTRALALEPKMAIAWGNRGNAYLELRQFEKAFADYDRDIELDPKNAIPWYCRANGCFRLHRYAQALLGFSKAVELDPTWWQAWNNLGVTYYCLHQYEKATPAFSRAIELEPRYFLAWVRRANAYRELRQWPRALADYATALALDPKHPEIWYQRGVCYTELGQWGPAAAAFKKARELKPLYEDPLRHHQAVAEYSQALERHPTDGDALYRRSCAYRKLGTWDKALADLGRLHEVKPALAPAWNDHAWILAACPETRRRDPVAAVNLAQKAVDLAPRERAYWRTLGLARYRAGQWRAALAALQRARQPGHGGNGLQSLLLALVNARLGRQAEARRHYERGNLWLAKTDPGDGNGFALRAEAAAVLDLPRLVEARTLPYRWEYDVDVHVMGVALSPDGRHVLAGGDDNDLRLYDARTGDEIRRFVRHTHWVYAVALSRGGRRALSGGEDKVVRLWDVATGQELRRLVGHTTGVQFVAFSPDGRRALSGGLVAGRRDPAMYLWDLKTGQPLRRFAGLPGGVLHAVFSPSGRRILSAGADKTIRLWAVETARELRRFETPRASTCVCFSPDGCRALSASPGEAALRLWDVATGKLLRRLEGYPVKKEAPHWVLFTPDGRHALSAHHVEGRLRLWDVDTGQELYWAQLERPLRMNRVTISADGRWVASANWRGSASVWQLVTPSPSSATKRK